MAKSKRIDKRGHIHIDPGMHNLVSQLAKSDRRNVTEIVRIAIENYLKLCKFRKGD